MNNRRLCDQHFLLCIDVGENFPPSRPGQFIQINCRPSDSVVDPIEHAWSGEKPPEFVHPEVVARPALLRRPFSLAGRHTREGHAVLEIIQRVVGTGSEYLSTLREGETVDVLGPLGNAFTWKDDIELAILVGGGVGIPPMQYLAEGLFLDKRRAVAFVGATSSNLLPLSVDGSISVSTAGWPSLCAREFTRFGVEAALCTDDGTLGFAGRVPDALWRWLDQGRFDPAKTCVYTCGPERMMHAIAEGCLQRNLSCQVAMERQMACGMGTCQSCVCRIHSDNVAGWEYKLVCTDGPVFDAHQLLWEK